MLDIGYMDRRIMQLDRERCKQSGAHYLWDGRWELLEESIWAKWIGNKFLTFESKEKPQIRGLPLSRAIKGMLAERSPSASVCVPNLDHLPRERLGRDIAFACTTEKWYVVIRCDRVGMWEQFLMTVGGGGWWKS